MGPDPKLLLQRFRQYLSATRFLRISLICSWTRCPESDYPLLAPAMYDRLCATDSLVSRWQKRQAVVRCAIRHGRLK